MMLLAVLVLLVAGVDGSNSVVVMHQAAQTTDHTAVQPTCPQHCKCSSHLRTINCEHQHLTAIPSDIPVNATTLLLGYNSLTSLPPNAFAHLPNLGTLSLKNNLLVDIHPAAFAGLSNLSVLYLTANKLAVLHVDAWLGLVGLQNLYLSQNQLTEVPDVGNCSSLKHLGLDNNKIANVIIPSSFSALKSFGSLTLNTNPISGLTARGLDALRNVPVTKLSLSVLTQLSHVENGTFRGLRSLTSLVFSYNPKLSLSGLQNILDSLGNSPLDSLDISSSIQTELPIPVNLFQGLQSVPLQKLFMKHHKITYIRNGTFQYLSKVSHLDLSEGNLVGIEDDTMSGLVSLQTLLITQNSLTSIPRGLPPALQYADFSHNKIPNIAPQTFLMNSKLENLTLAHCGIRTISEEAFLGLTNLQNLDLSHNGLGNNNIAVRTFRSTTSLRILDLSNNQIMSIGTERNLFMYATDLRFLDMSHNSLNNFSTELFSPLAKLEELHLAGNSLPKMISMDQSGMIFSNLSHLVTLDLSHSGITELPAQIFHGLVSLRRLNLSGNVFHTWPGDVFQAVTHLADLDLSKNRITVVTESALSVLDTFGANLSMDLSGNQFDCYCDLRWFRDWMDVTNVTLVDENQYTCETPPDMRSKKVLDFHPHDIKIKCLLNEYLWYFVAGAVVLFVLFILVPIFLYKKRFWIQLRWYRVRKRQRRPGYQQLQESVTYLGVIFYADENETWVADIIDKLKGSGIKEELLFYREANCHPGQGRVNFTGSLIDTTSESFRTVIVLSHQYLQDSYFQFELHELIDELVKKTKDEAKHLSEVILVLLEAEAGEEIMIRDKVPRALQSVVKNDDQCLVWKATDSSAQTLCTEKLVESLQRGMEHVAGGTGDAGQASYDTNGAAVNV